MWYDPKSPWDLANFWSQFTNHLRWLKKKHKRDKDYDSEVFLYLEKKKVKTHKRIMRYLGWKFIDGLWEIPEDKDKYRQVIVIHLAHGQHYVTVVNNTSMGWVSKEKAASYLEAWKVALARVNKDTKYQSWICVAI